MEQSKYKLFWLIPATILIFTFVFFQPIANIKASTCHQLDSTKPIPANFGAAYNTLSSQKETLIDVDCHINSVDISVGNGSAFQYIYKKGYIWRNNAWQEIIFTPAGQLIGSWIVGKGQLTINFTPAELLNINSIVMYICNWAGGQWKCGCRDSICNNNYWQLQEFQQISASCVDSDNDGYGVCPDCSVANGCSYDGGDCDDNEYWANPGGIETCDNIDNNCNNQTDEDCDNDHDDYCDNTMPVYRNNSMCTKTSVPDYTTGYNGDDCNDSNNSINPGGTEICGNGIDEDCNGFDAICQPVCGNGICESSENCTNCPADCGVCPDTTSPIVTFFDIQPLTSTGSVIATWSVTDETALNRVELWRALDVSGVPGTWSQITSQNVSGTSVSGNFTDTPSVGTWWYGLHVVDQADNWANEGSLGPIMIEKNEGSALDSTCANWQTLHPEWIMCEDWDSENPPASDWPECNGGSWNGWTPRGWDCHGPGADILDTTIKHSGTRSWLQRKRTTDYQSTGLQLDIPAVSKIHARMYIYFTDTWNNANKVEGDRDAYIHFIFWDSAVAYSGFGVDVLSRTDEKPWNIICGDAGGGTTVFAFHSSHAGDGDDEWQIGSNSPEDCWFIEQHLNEWHCYEWMFDLDNDKRKLWIDGDLRMDRDMVESAWDYIDWMFMVLYMNSDAVNDEIKVYFDDIVLSTEYIGPISN